MKIGLFDSGIGGLTVMAHLKKLLPNEEYYYYADTDNVPYGTKTKEQIVDYSRAAIAFLIDKGCDIVCIACNTATSVAASIVRAETNVPIVGVEPAVKPAVTEDKEGRILVVATPVTVREKKLKDLIDRVDDEHLVDLLSLERLPGYAEKGDFDSKNLLNYLDEAFRGVDTSLYSRVVLGCTHFIHFQKVLSKYFNEDIEFLDGCEGTARNIKRIADNMKLTSANSYSEYFYQSGRNVEDEDRIGFYHMILDRLA